MPGFQLYTNIVLSYQRNVFYLILPEIFTNIYKPINREKEIKKTITTFCQLQDSAAIKRSIFFNIVHKS